MKLSISPGRSDGPAVNFADIEVGQMGLIVSAAYSPRVGHYIIRTTRGDVVDLTDGHTWDAAYVAGDVTHSVRHLHVGESFTITRTA